MAKKAIADKTICVACGVCQKVCPKQAIIIIKGCYAEVNREKCVGCGICAKNCPAGCMETKEAKTND